MIRHDPTASKPSEPLTSQNVERGDDAFRNYDRFSQFRNGHSFGLQTFASLRKRVPAAGKTLHKRKICVQSQKGFVFRIEQASWTELKPDLALKRFIEYPKLFASIDSNKLAENQKFD
jgi:hypothetical protein